MQLLLGRYEPGQFLLGVSSVIVLTFKQVVDKLLFLSILAEGVEEVRQLAEGLNFGEPETPHFSKFIVLIIEHSLLCSLDQIEDASTGFKEFK